MAHKNTDLIFDNTPENDWEDLWFDEEEDYTYTGDNTYFTTTKEVQDYDFAQEPRTDLSKLIVPHVEQIPEMLSFDYLKLVFPLTKADVAKLTFNRKAFMRSNSPQIPATHNETYERLVKYAEGIPTMTMELTEKEEAFTDLSMEYEYARMHYPNAKPFYSRSRKRMGFVHLYVYRGELIVMFTGKTVCGTGDLGLISCNTIHRALDVIKSTGLVDFNNEAFINIAQVLTVHVTNDVDVGWVNAYVKAFSSYMPMRTDKYNVLKYPTGYLVLPTGKPAKTKPKYEFCIYDKGAEIRSKHNKIYRERIGKEGVNLANRTLRQELRLFNFPAIRKFIAPEKEDGTVTLKELLDCKRTPILKMLNLLEITVKGLELALGEYITMYEDETFPSQAEFERMQGLIHMLEQHNYNLDKVRSYIEVETHHKTHSTYFQMKRATLQQYITCYKPRTIVLLKELLAGMSY